MATTKRALGYYIISKQRLQDFLRLIELTLRVLSWETGLSTITSKQETATIPCS